MSKISTWSFKVSDKKSGYDVSMREDGSFDVITYVTQDEMNRILYTAAEIDKSRNVRQ